MIGGLQCWAYPPESNAYPHFPHQIAEASVVLLPREGCAQGAAPWLCARAVQSSFSPCDPEPNILKKTSVVVSVLEDWTLRCWFDQYFHLCHVVKFSQSFHSLQHVNRHIGDDLYNFN